MFPSPGPSETETFPSLFPPERVGFPLDFLLLSPNRSPSIPQSKEIRQIDPDSPFLQRQEADVVNPVSDSETHHTSPEPRPVSTSALGAPASLLLPEPPTLDLDPFILEQQEADIVTPDLDSEFQHTSPEPRPVSTSALGAPATASLYYPRH